MVRTLMGKGLRNNRNRFAVKIFKDEGQGGGYSPFEYYNLREFYHLPIVSLQKSAAVDQEDATFQETSPKVSHWG